MLTEKEFRVKLLQWNRAFRNISSMRDDYKTDSKITDFRGGVGKWLLLLAKAARAESEITEETVEQDIQELDSRGIVYNGKCRIGERVVFIMEDYSTVRQEYVLLRTGRLDEFLEQDGAFKRNKTLKMAVGALKRYHPLYWCTCINMWDENKLKEAGVDRLDENALKMYEHAFFELHSEKWAKVEEGLLDNKKSLQYLTKNYYDAIMDNWFFLTGDYGTGSTEEDFDRYAKIMWNIYQKVSEQ